MTPMNTLYKECRVDELWQNPAIGFLRNPAAGAVQERDCRKGANREHETLAKDVRKRMSIPLLVMTAIVAEEEYKNVLHSGARYRAPRGAPYRTNRTHSAIVLTSSSYGHAIMKPASVDERLLVHPLVLAVEPATLQAATLMQATRDASVDRSPPAATLQLPMGGWSVVCCGRGPSARPSHHKPAYPFPVPSHSRPPAAAHTRAAKPLTRVNSNAAYL